MKYEICEVTPHQLKLWGETRAAMIWHAPAFTHLLYTMMNKSGGEHIAVFTKDVPVAATDGSAVIINPDTFFKYNLDQRVFVVGHEIVHGFLGHAELMHKLGMAGKVCYPDGTELPFNPDLFNKSMDYMVNDLLIDGKIGTYCTDWLHDKNIGTMNDAVIDIYRKLYRGGGGKGGGASFDVLLPPGTVQKKDPSQAASERNDVEWKTAIAGALAVAKAQGKLPASLERLFGKELEPEVDWTDKVIGFFNRKAGGGSYDWRKPDRRFITRGIIAPARAGFGCGPLVVAVDSSGSISQHTYDRFFAETAGMIDDVRPSMIHFMFCDAKVHKVVELEDAMDLRELRVQPVPGGGGTKFWPVFDKVAELGIEPDALVYLTDGFGQFPHVAPSYPVLWGDISGSVKYPFGEVVTVPVK